MNGELNIPWPEKGISEGRANDEQPPLTCREAINVRGIDPLTKRVRGAQRSGMTKYIDTTVNGANKIQELVTVTADNKLTTYAAASLYGAATKTSVTLPNKQECWDLVTDDQSNVYALDPKASIVKYNSELQVVWKAQVPVKDALGELRCIEVDEARWIYAGVSQGGSQEKARLYAYEQTSTTKAELVWEYDAGGFIDDIRYSDGKLHFTVNDTLRGLSKVVVLSGLNTASPTLERQWQIPYPVNALSVSPKDGSVYTSHEPSSTRGRDPRNSAIVGSWEDWTPLNLTSSEKRIWGWWDAADVDADGTFNSAYADGDQITEWFDKSGNNRNWFVNTAAATTERGPTLAKNVVGGKDVLVFDGGAFANNGASMMSGTNPDSSSPGSDSTSRAAHRSAIPCYAGAQFCLVVAMRTPADAVQRVLFGQDATNSHAAGTFRGVITNSLPATMGTFNAGIGCVRVVESTTGSSETASGPNAMPLSTGFGPDDFCVVTWIFNGGQDNTTAGQSCVRINGRPADSYYSLNSYTSTDASFLGWYRGISASIERFRGYICEMIVLNDWYVPGATPLDAPTRQTLVTNQDYPDSTWAVYTTGVKEVEQLEGYMTGRWGGGHKLPSGTAESLASTAEPADAETVTIGSRVYTFKNALGAPAAGNVHVKRTATNALLDYINLYKAINNSGVSGTDYVYATGEGAHPDVFALCVTSSDSTGGTARPTLFIQTRTSKDTPTVALSETLGSGAWRGGATATSVPINSTTTNQGHYPHPYYYLRTNTNRFIGSPPSSSSTSVFSEYQDLHGWWGMLCKWNPLNAKLRWVATSGKRGLSTAYGGIGYGCVADSSGGVYTAGPRQDDASTPWTITNVGNDGKYDVMRIVDGDDTFSIGFRSQLSTSTSASVDPFDYTHLRLSVDKYDNAYVPWYDQDGDATYVPAIGIVALNTSGTVLHQYGTTSGTQFHVAVPDPTIPSNIGDDLNGTSQSLQPRAEFVYGGGRVENIVTLTSDGTEPDDATSVIIGARTYTFKNALGAPAAGTVHVKRSGTSVATDYLNLYLAINATGTNGSNYQYSAGEGAHPTYRCIGYNTSGPLLTMRKISPSKSTSDLTTTLSADALSHSSWSTEALDSNTVYKATLVTSTPTGGSPRTTKILAVSGNSIKRVASPSTVTSLSGGGFTASTSQYIQGVALGQKVYFTNGEEYKVYDPKTDAVGTYRSAKGGEIPRRCKLIESWRNRIVIARGADDPQNWHMSAVGDPTDWDQFPPVVTKSQAISGNNAEAGRCPDIINTLVPWSDDLLFMGGDRSIWRLTGDPMAGGQIDLVSNMTGMSFGRPWAKDKEGMLYFFGSAAGLYTMSPAGAIKKISDKKIDARLDEYDLSTHHLRLIWNEDEHAIHLFAVPFGSGGTHIKHYVWEQLTGAFYQDEFGSTNTSLTGYTSVQPTAVMMYDGDENSDRVMLIGCEDGYIRFWDKDARNDGGTAANSAIDSQIIFGPITLDSETEIRLNAISILLASNQQGTRVAVYATNEPDSLGLPVYNGSVMPGRNQWMRIKARGKYIFIQFRSSTFDARWAFENMVLNVAEAGRVRVRR